MFKTEDFIQRDVDWAPYPNVIQFFRTDEMAPEGLTSSAFMIPFNRGDLVLAHIKKRDSLELPGGHVERGETPTKAAHRECLEEIGWWVSHIRPFGYVRVSCGGHEPKDYKYPWPVSYMQYFTADCMHYDYSKILTEESGGPFTIYTRFASDYVGEMQGKIAELAIYERMNNA